MSVISDPRLKKVVDAVMTIVKVNAQLDTPVSNIQGLIAMVKEHGD